MTTMLDHSGLALLDESTGYLYDEQGQAENALTADDVEAASEVGTPALGQVHNIADSGVESASGVSSPALAEAGEDGLLANDIESASEVLRPNFGQVHKIADSGVQSTSEASTPTLVRLYVFSPSGVESASEVTAPAAAQIHVLVPTGAESASEASAPGLGQVHALGAESIESASEISTPALVGNIFDNLAADDIESASEATTPVIAQVHVLFPDGVESQSEITAPALGHTGDHVMFANDIESASEVSAPSLGQKYSRAKDQTSIDLSGYDFSAGITVTIYGNLGDIAGATDHIIQLDNGTDNHRIRLYHSNADGKLYVGVDAGGVSQVGTLIGSAYTPGTDFHFAISISSAGVVVAVLDGSTVVNVTGKTLPTITGLSVGMDRVGGNVPARLDHFETRLVEGPVGEADLKEAAA